MDRALSVTYISILIVFLNSCAVQHTSYRKGEEYTPQSFSENAHGDLKYQIFVAGGSGNFDAVEDPIVVRAMKEHLKTVTVPSATIFIGDNAGPNGLPKKKAEGRLAAEKRLNTQLSIVDGYEGEVVFLAGNEDWNSGLQGLKRQEKFIEKTLKNKHTFLPKAGCGGPEVIKLSDDIVIIAIDSHWWTVDWNKTPEVNENCEFDSRKTFLNAFYEAIKKNQEKQIFVTMHHPIKSSGPHGGGYTAKQLLLPIPFISGLVRKNIGLPQDNSNAKLSDLYTKLLQRTAKYKNVVFLSGHELALQYAETEDNKFISSGSASQSSAGYLGPDHLFYHPGLGYVALNFYEDGSTYAEFYSVDGDAKPKVIFKKQIHQPYEKKYDFDDTIFSERPDTISASIYSDSIREGLNKKMTGELYRKLYYNARECPVLYLDEFMGGLEVVKKGGGNQTNSLRLVDKNGVEFGLRSLEKDISRMAFGILDNSFLESITKDAFTWTNPFAMNAIPTLSEATGVYYGKSQIYYLPQQPGLGKYNESFGDGLYFFEQRPDGDKSDIDNFGNSEKIISSFDLIDKVLKNYKHKIDKEQLIKSRLLDLMLGDNDRHFDQWRWASFKKDNYTLYQPIPRDRDQALISMKGPLFGIAKMLSPLFRTFQNYEGYMQNDVWFHYNASGFDRFFINDIPWSQWESQVEIMQNQLTDEIIESAIQLMPDDAYQFRGAELIASMKQRRSNLKQMARSLYDLHARTVAVHGTSKKDHIIVDFLENGHVNVKVSLQSDGSQKVKFLRTLDPLETKEVVIYGLDNNDRFEVTGNHKTSIKVRLVGGEDRDEFVISGSYSHKVLIYDDLDKNEIIQKDKARDRRSNDYDRNYFDRDTRSSIPKSQFIPYLYYDSDDKILLGLTSVFRVHGFGKYPFSQLHKVRTSLATGTSGASLSYDGYFYKALGDWGISIHGSYSNPRSTSNYFGFGNETNESTNLENAFNQVRIGRVAGGVGLFNDLSTGMRLSFSTRLENTEVQETIGRYISDPAVRPELGASPFADKSFIYSEISFEYNNAHNFFPTEGVDFSAKVQLTNNFFENKSFGSFYTHLSIYQNLTRRKNLVWASKFSYETVGSGYQFFQSASVGGKRSIRGYRDGRFRGHQSFVALSDIRWSIGSVRNSFIPLKVGMFGSFDGGRVWLKGESSNQWHSSFGGGVWFEIFGLAGASVGYHYTDEDSSQLQIGLGFNF